MKRLLVPLLLVLLVVLQYRLWLSDGGLIKSWHLRQAVDEQRKENAQLTERNRALEAEVRDLKQGLDAVEERARAELGMVKKDETFFQVVSEPNPTQP